MNDLKTINHDVKKINKHATTRPKLNAKFQNQGPLLPERKGFENNFSSVTLITLIMLIRGKILNNVIFIIMHVHLR